MSLLSPESLSVFISPTELLAVRWLGLRPQIVEKRRCALAVRPGTAWETGVEALATLLLEFSACRQVRIILSSHFTPYQLMPWRDDLNDSDEELTVARLAFTQTYGEVAARWQIRLSDEAPGQARVAAAVDTGLLAALEQLAAANSVRLVSIQPYLVAAVNYWRQRFNHDYSAWLVLHEEGRLCLALIEAGRWRWVRSVRIDADWTRRLPDLLDNETLLADAERLPAHALIYSPVSPELAVPVDSSWSFRRLDVEARTNFSPVSDGRFGLALVG